ncbi:MAG: adenylate/guanylate cyclase domain-containing protein [Candidatus Rokuibacteriota bacterium]
MAERLRPWNWLSVRLAAAFVVLTLFAVGLVGAVVYERQKKDVEETIGVLLLNVSRTGALLIDPDAHAEVQRSRRTDSPAYGRVRAALAAIEREAVLSTPVYTLTDFDATRRHARFMVTSRGPGAPGEAYPLVPELIEPLGWTFEDGVARFTRIYRNQSGTWITAFAPITDPSGRTIAVLDVDYPVDVYFTRIDEVRTQILQAAAIGAVCAALAGLLLARRLTRPIQALTVSAARVAAGDLSRALAITSRDEVGQLTRTFNEMVEGLRQRDFIRDTFGRYVSPEVAKTLLESPEGLRLGGEKREVTILMSDLRGYTRFAERGSPEQVVGVLNDYLARMADLVLSHGGTVNEFIGDAVFAIFGAPMARADHAERAAAAALAMQEAMAEINAAHVARELPPFEMGIGINSGEAVVGNIGSEQRAKYAVVGSAVNIASRVEGSTVGGQILISAATLERIGDLAEVGPPIPVRVKGLAEPLVLHELHAIGGRFARRLPEAPGADRAVDVTLPAECWTIEGKAVAAQVARGDVVRLGPGRLDLRLPAPPPPLTNLLIRLQYPTLGHGSGDLYGKVVGEDADAVGHVTRVRLTSVDPADQEVFERLLGVGQP